MIIDRAEIDRLTEASGGQWGINHTRRLLPLISISGEGRTYHAAVVWLAAQLHDWGAYAAWAQPDVDQAVRSTQVAETFLAERTPTPAEVQFVLESIEFQQMDNFLAAFEADSFGCF